MASFVFQLPLIFLKFWFWEAPREQIAFFSSLNSAFVQLFSLPLLLRTFFKPWKNEYREGLVGFSIGMGMFIKAIVIIVDVALLLLLISLEIIFIGFWLFWPIGTIWLIIL